MEEKAEEEIKLETLNEINVEEIVAGELASKARRSRI
jgi:diphthamide synthase (EF-2-diphthine--ammonia ligase)